MITVYVTKEEYENKCVYNNNVVHIVCDECYEILTLEEYENKYGSYKLLSTIGSSYVKSILAFHSTSYGSIDESLRRGAREVYAQFFRIGIPLIAFILDKNRKPDKKNLRDTYKRTRGFY